MNMFGKSSQSYSGLAHRSQIMTMHFYKSENREFQEQCCYLQKA